MLFQGFETHDLVIGDVNIHFVRGGEGPGLLLLHGIPQTYVMWHKVAPALSEHFTVIAADLRGQIRAKKPCRAMHK
jgi:haloacetate dehalogenase